MDKTKIAKIAGVVLLASAAIGAGAHDVLEQPEVVVENVTVEKIVEVPVNVTKEVIVEKNVTVEVEVPVEDEAFKALACDRLIYDDIAECVEEVEAEDAALKLAIAEIEAEFAEELEDDNAVRKDSDVRIIDVKADFEDITVVKSNFDNDKYVFEIDVKYEDEREEDKETVTVKVRVEDSEAEILSIN